MAPPLNVPIAGIAVHPALGWWRTRPGEERYEERVRHSLIVSIVTPDQAVDI